MTEHYTAFSFLMLALYARPAFTFARHNANLFTWVNNCSLSPEISPRQLK